MKDGDTVVLTKPCRVDRYVYDRERDMSSWDFMYLLPGCVGKVIRAKTPCVLYAPKKEPAFFANVDVEYMGETHRVREFHDHFERVKA